MQTTITKEPIKLRGFYRVNITDDEQVVGDSGWFENQITNEGVRDYLARLLGALAGSKQVSHAALGTGGAPASNATTLTGEVEVRAAVTAATSGSTAVQFTATFSSANSFVTDTRNISNIGLFNTSAGGTLFAGNTYASSSVATNQNVNVTYTITFTR
jgi:hypothetical protein